ncbi:putative VP1 [Microviridae sp.]|nr:putative VP1 [Microviridae sp.]WNN13253.1 MAG: major capsid protein [Microviridae sp.]
MARTRRMPSHMKAHFSVAPSSPVSRSSFDRSHSLKTTMDFDYLNVIYVDEVLPGDTFSLRLTHLCRLNTLVQPLLDNVSLTVQFFYVPCRLLWHGENTGWEQFITGSDQPVAWTGDNPADKLFLPQAVAPEGGYKEGSIYDYMGLPTKVANFRHTVLPLRAYNLIWNEYYRDQNLQESVPVWTGDSDPKVNELGEEDVNGSPYQYSLLKRCKRWDYFTSALPGLQRGPQVGINLSGGDAGRLPVHGLALEQFQTGTSVYTPPVPANATSLGAAQSIQVSGQTLPSYFGIDGPINTDRTSTQGNWLFNLRGSYQGAPVVHTPSGSPSTYNMTPQLNAENWPIYVDLSAASSVTINSLRSAITLQHWYEAAAKYGGRYTEVLNGFFNVHSGDARLQRPEFLGSIKTYIQVNPVVQTSSTDNVSPQGNLAAYALSTGSKHLFTKSFVEHGYILGLCSLQSDLSYQQGLDKMWSRFSRYDFYWPTFSHLSEQPVLNQEIYTQSDSVVDSNGVSINSLPFGYQERYAEYRYKPSKITGLFRSNATGTLDSWHLAQKFDNLPTLNKTFIESNTPIERVLAVPNQPDLLCDFFFSLRCVRPLPVYSVPGLKRL